MARVRTLFALAIVAASTTACTAIILGTLDDEKALADGGTQGTSSGGTSGTSGSSSSQGDPCSLVGMGTYGYSLGPKNECSECIATSCAQNAAYACNDGGNYKSWWQSMKLCAQNPWLAYPSPEGGGGDEWGCGDWDKSKPDEITGTSDPAAQRAAEICVKTNCVRDAGEPAPCRQCDVYFATGKDKFLLRDDPCGSCFTEQCGQTVVDCCTSSAMSDFVRYCGFTNDGDNLEKCSGIGDASDLSTFVPPGSYGYQDGSVGLDCAHRLGKCWVDKCSKRAECKGK